MALWGFGFVLLLLSVGCHRGEVLTAADKLDQTTSTFDIYWPPMDPEGTLAASFKPLLSATLTVDATEQSEGGAEVRLGVTRS